MLRYRFPQEPHTYTYNLAHYQHRNSLVSRYLCLFVMLLIGGCSQLASPAENPTTASATQLTATEWPMEGQGPQRNRANIDALKLPLGAPEQYIVEGDAEHVSPIAIAGGRLFAESDRKLHAVALASGKEQWQSNFAGSFLSPAVVDNTVFVRSETGEEGFVYALAADTGVKRWQYQFAKVGSSFGNVGGHVTSPVIVDHLILVGAAQTFHALDIKSGQEVWKFATQYPVVSSASVADGLVYFADFTRLYAVDLKTGQARWHFDHDKQAIFFAPVILDHQVALAGSDTIYLLDRTTGKQLWSRTFADVTVIPAGASAQYLYIKSTNQLFALKLLDGTTAWDYTTINFISLPAIAQDQLYVITRSGNDGQVRALQQSDGKEVWHTEQVGLASAAPVIAGGRLYVRLATGNVLVFPSS